MPLHKAWSRTKHLRSAASNRLRGCAGWAPPCWTGLFGIMLGGLMYARMITESIPTVVAGLSGIAFLAWIVVNIYLLVTRGQSVAKLILKIRVVRPVGSQVSWGRLLGLRYVVPALINSIPLVGILFTLIDPLMIFRDSRRCLHDDLADTIVVKA
jgi:uncharacterized RDD family membrane protein YckC